MSPERQRQAMKPVNRNFEKAVRESFAREGLMGTIGAWLVAVEPGRVVIELPFSGRLAARPGEFHGAVIGALSEAAGTYAALTVMPAGSSASTVEYKINFLAPAKGSLARATAEVVQADAGQCVIRVDVVVVERARERACAVMQGTATQVASRRR